MVKESDSSLNVDNLNVESWRVIESYRADDLSLVGVSSDGRDSLRESSSRRRSGSGHWWRRRDLRRREAKWTVSERLRERAGDQRERWKSHF